MLMLMPGLGRFFLLSRSGVLMTSVLFLLGCALLLRASRRAPVTAVIAVTGMTLALAALGALKFLENVLCEAGAQSRQAKDSANGGRKATHARTCQH